jgi:hypothetical protein
MTSRDREGVVRSGGVRSQGGLAIGPEELHHRLGGCRGTVELLEEQA